MKTEFCQWLNDLSDLAEKENVIVEAKYFDGLDYFFKSGESPESALPLYKDLVLRIDAIQQDFNTKDLMRLTEMSGDHFSSIFTEGFAPVFIKDIVSSFWSLRGFHNAIASYGKFDSHRIATDLGYDVEFTLDQP